MKDLSFPTLLREWFNSQTLTSVEFGENHSPKNDPPDDYVVAYEATFRTRHPDEAMVGLSITEDSYIGIGLETRDRLADRLSIRNLRRGFAAGREPCETDDKSVLHFLDLVRGGKIAVGARIGPWIGLGKTEAMVPSESRTVEWAPFDRLKTVHTLEAHGNKRILTFRPWS